MNYLYFGAFLGIMLLTSASSIFIKDTLAGSRTFFFLYATGQAVFETLSFLFITWAASLYLGSFAAMVFIGATFIFLVLHLLDFCIERVLDLSIWETFSFVLDENWDNFFYLLDASGISLWIWALFFLVFAALPFIGIAFYAWTMRLSSWRLFYLRPESILQAFICIPAALFFWEFSASRVLHPDSYTSFLKSLPWKWTFLQPKTIRYPIPASLTSPKREEVILAEIAQDHTMLAQKPNIYLFIIESLREDFINADVAPNLHRFKEGSNHFDLALSNANGSHLSWFSIFHSQFSYFWQSVQLQGWKMGSPAIQLLKKWGYKVRLYSSAQLKYYNMEELLFGKGMHLIDACHIFPHPPPLSAADTDAQTIAQWQQDASENLDLTEGQLVIFFWDSTHFNYSWPKHWPPKFIPISKDIDYFNMFQSRNKIEKIKNRYRNSVHYVDFLFGEALKMLPDSDNSIVIVIGDHGEEFFERGHLFHGSHLIHEQINIPLYMKFGQRKEAAPPKIVSQMDVFPSLLHHLSGKTIPFLEGRSIFSKERWPYAIISRNNAGRSPYEFCLHNGTYKLIARFENKKNILSSKNLSIRSLWNCHDQYVFDCKDQISNWIQEEFGSAIERLFTPDPLECKTQ
ncbi:MAG TPA: sulfatase-like hydrolase/transferase [Chlamydiales bacterium]|nr:sulfatase-like hydrolase/transferase [Chlamydiales bacterium]